MIDADALRWASLENLERLARSLGLTVDTSGMRRERKRQVVKAIVRKLDDEKKEKERCVLK